MKRFGAFKFLVLCIAMSGLMIGCKDKKKACDCCTGFKPVEKSYPDGRKIKVYTAFTPDNLPFCDSIVRDKNGVETRDAKRCRPNFDSVYNDKSNTYFHIEGIEEFPYNTLIIRVPGDTTKVNVFTDYANISGAGKNAFNGTTSDTTLFGADRERQLISGKYEFILQLYSSDKYDKASRIDSIQGYFCIIRTGNYKNEGCVAKEAGDKLIK